MWSKIFSNSNILKLHEKVDELLMDKSGVTDEELDYIASMLIYTYGKDNAVSKHTLYTQYGFNEDGNYYIKGFIEKDTLKVLGYVKETYTQDGITIDTCISDELRYDHRARVEKTLEKIEKY